MQPLRKENQFKTDESKLPNLMAFMQSHFNQNPFLDDHNLNNKNPFASNPFLSSGLFDQQNLLSTSYYPHHDIPRAKPVLTHQSHQNPNQSIFDLIQQINQTVENLTSLVDSTSSRPSCNQPRH